MWFSSVTLYIAVLCLVCIAWGKRKSKKQAQLPPGPPPLPLIGNLLQIRTQNLLTSLQEFREKYGPVFTVYFGSRPVVILHGYDAIKEALVDQKHAFSARGKMSINDIVMKGYGIVGSNGERWKQMRRFALTTLRNFGMGKRSVEERIQEEAQFLVEEFGKTEGKPFDPTFFLSCAVSNIICSVVFGNRFDFDDQRFLSLLNHPGVLILLYNFPQLFRHIPGPHQRIVKYISELRTFVREKVEESKESLDPQSPRHFIDCFLVKMQEDQKNPDTEFHLENLVASTVNLFFAGTETVSSTLRYGFLILLKCPEIQAKIQNEIDQVIGHRYPSADDRSRMPYTEAVIHEIQRFSDVIPVGLPHTTAEDVVFRNYTIPKGTDVLPLLTTSLKSPEQFPDPKVFLPERFLDDQGTLKKCPTLLPFSAGKRICPGEGLARMELFLFITTILQNFTLTTTVPQDELDLSPEMNSSGHFPRFYKMCTIPRTRIAPSFMPS